MTLHKRLTRSGFFSQPGVLFVVTIVFVFVVASLLIISNRREAAREHANTDTQWSLIARSITARDHTIGNIDAPIQLVIFADFQCKYCGSMFERKVPELRATYGDRIVIAFRHLPLPSQPQAQIEAEASECIYQQGGEKAFWRFAHRIYTTPHFDKGIDLSTLSSLAIDAGVDRTQYDICMKKGGGKERVRQDTLEGTIAGISITPSVVLKSQYRATIVEGGYGPGVKGAIEYLFETNKQISQRK